MKFQNRSIHGSKVNRRTDRQTDKPKAICPSNFFKVGGIKIIRHYQQHQPLTIHEHVKRSIAWWMRLFNLECWPYTVTEMRSREGILLIVPIFPDHCFCRQRIRDL